MALIATAVVWFFVIMAILSLFSCRAPDRLDVGYGHTFSSGGEVGTLPKGLDFDGGDSDSVFASVGWNLRPTQVQVVEDYRRSWWPDWCDPSAPAAAEVRTDKVKQVAETFSALDLASKIVLLVCVCWLGWVYRKQIGKLIPKFGNGNGK